jgi:uncharacterized membrane protein YqgA involved in biofilm formation
VYGTLLNALALLAGGVWGLAGRTLSPARQSLLRALLGTFVVYAGLRLLWNSISGSAGAVGKQFGILLLAMILGKLLGRLCGLQRASNRLGTLARERLERGQPADGLLVVTILSCLNPLALTGALHEGLSPLGYPYAAYPLAVKSAMDALAMMAFAPHFGRRVLLAVVPVVAFQGLIFLVGRSATEWLEHQGVLHSLNAALAMIFVSASLVVFEVKRVELANYLPSLLIAPLLTWLWR